MAETTGKPMRCADGPHVWVNGSYACECGAYERYRAPAASPRPEPTPEPGEVLQQGVAFDAVDIWNAYAAGAHDAHAVLQRDISAGQSFDALVQRSCDAYTKLAHTRKPRSAAMTLFARSTPVRDEPAEPSEDALPDVARRCCCCGEPLTWDGELRRCWSPRCRLFKIDQTPRAFLLAEAKQQRDVAREGGMLWRIANLALTSGRSSGVRDESAGIAGTDVEALELYEQIGREVCAEFNGQRYAVLAEGWAHNRLVNLIARLRGAAGGQP